MNAAAKSVAIGVVSGLIVMYLWDRFGRPAATPAPAPAQPDNGSWLPWF